MSPYCKWGRSLWKWSNFLLSRARDLDLDLGSRHTAYQHASVVYLYLHTKLHWNRRNFLWVDGRTDGHLRPALLGRLFRVDLKIVDKSLPRAVCTNRKYSQIKWSVLIAYQFEERVVVRSVASKIEAMSRTNNTPSSPQRLSINIMYTLATYI